MRYYASYKGIIAMPRLPRVKVEDEDGWYHLWNSANGQKRAFPLQDDVVRTEFIRLLRFYSGIYFCGVAAFQVMGSHFHLVLRFDKPRAVSRMEIESPRGHSTGRSA